ncbi:MAG: polysaccharide deacetylase family protein [Actinobacteria bacterium]|nr:polysaccharide deacetylase family protein [Actinomycetota bacterium]
MRHTTINHRDINGKAFTLLLIYIIATVVIFQAQKLPARRVPEGSNVVNALEAEGGRIYSLLPDGNSRIEALGLRYLAPRGKPPESPATKVTLEMIRDAGLLKGYSLPPDRLAFTPRGDAVVLPTPPAPGGPVNPAVYHTGNRNRPRIALTFDTNDIREPQARAIIDTMSALKAPATFFVCGGWCYANPDLLRMAIGRGFEIANHSFGHPWFTHITNEQIVDELRRTERAVEEVGGIKIAAYFRPPFGDYDARVELVAASIGYPIVLWNRDTRDWHPATIPEELRDRASAWAQNGDIVIMHTHGQYTASMLPQIVDNLRAKGFELTTVSGVLQP